MQIVERRVKYERHADNMRDFRKVSVNLDFDHFSIKTDVMRDDTIASHIRIVERDERVFYRNASRITGITRDTGKVGDKLVDDRVVRYADIFIVSSFEHPILRVVYYKPEL
jgi:hypothetical protein